MFVLQVDQLDNLRLDVQFRLDMLFMNKTPGHILLMNIKLGIIYINDSLGCILK